MATMRIDMVNLDEERAELRAVLESRSFARAPKLAGLLSYLCEKMFSGEARQIKEYSIGVEVFSRGDDFDQDSDSIVRVEANRLRKRLAEYYAEEGMGHRLRIAIPIGQYVPEFKQASPRLEPPATGDSPPGAQDGEGQGGSAGAKQRGLGESRKQQAWWLGVALAVLSMGGGALAVLHWERPKPVATRQQQPAAQTETLFGLPTGEEVRILAGSDRSLVDHGGKLWLADNWYTAGSAVKSGAEHIWRTQNQAFYRTSRQGNFRYDIPLKPGVYELRLHFAETIFGPEGNNTGGEGSRVMTVKANGKVLLNWFDVVADAGGSRTADVKVFPNISPLSDGMLHIEFAGQNGEAAMVSAIEILPGVKGRMRPVRLLARQTPYYSNDSQWWSPDNFFQGGQMATYAAAVGGTDDPEMFESERWGNFTYAVPVSPGRYGLTLYFVARHGDWPPVTVGGNSVKVSHIFSVFCNGRALLENFDPAKEAKDADVVVRRITGLEPNAQGKLVLSFAPVQGYATVTGIEVVAQ